VNRGTNPGTQTQAWTSTAASPRDDGSVAVAAIAAVSTETAAAAPLTSSRRPSRVLPVPAASTSAPITGTLTAATTSTTVLSSPGSPQAERAVTRSTAASADSTAAAATATAAQPPRDRLARPGRAGRARVVVMAGILGRRSDSQASDGPYNN
jgi:hypothetical protein